jgi:hypothetical protein
VQLGLMFDRKRWILRGMTRASAWTSDTATRTNPLAGVIRFAQPGERDVDLVVGRFQWQRDIIGRANTINLGDIQH